MTFTGQSNLKEFLNILNKQFSNNELSEINRLLNLYSHGKHSDLEAPIADSQELELFKRLFSEIVDSLHFKV